MHKLDEIRLRSIIHIKLNVKLNDSARDIFSEERKRENKVK